MFTLHRLRLLRQTIIFVILADVRLGYICRRFQTIRKLRILIGILIQVETTTHYVPVLLVEAHRVLETVDHVRLRLRVIIVLVHTVKNNIFLCAL